MAACLILASACFGNSLPQFHIMTEEWRPYNFSQGGRLQGISVDFLGMMLKEVGSNQTIADIKLYPWTRAYRVAQKERHTILFSTTRTKEREQMFKWVGPVFQNQISLHALKKRKIKINSPEELKKYKIATYFNDAGERVLINDFGFAKEELHRSSQQVHGLVRVYK